MSKAACFFSFSFLQPSPRRPEGRPYGLPPKKEFTEKRRQRKPKVRFSIPFLFRHIADLARLIVQISRRNVVAFLFLRHISLHFFVPPRIG